MSILSASESRLRAPLAAFTAILLMSSAATAANPQSEEFFGDAVRRLQSSDRAAAVIQLRNALQADPANVDARLLLGRLALEDGDVAAAERDLRKVLEARPTPEVRALLARTLTAAGKADQALTLLDVDLGRPGAGPATGLARSAALAALGRFEDADAALRPVLDRDPLDPDANLQAARNAIARGDTTAGADLARRAAQLAPASVEAAFLDAQMQMATGRLDDAGRALERMDELRPGLPAGRLLQVELAMRRGKLDDAETKARDLLAIVPGDVSGTYLLASIQAARGQPAEADRTLRQVEDKLRDFAPALLLGGSIKAQLGQSAQAESRLTRYLTLWPDARTPRRLLAKLQLDTGRGQSGWETLQPITGPQSQDVPALTLRSSAAMLAGKWSDARATFRRLQTMGQVPAAQAAPFLGLLGAGTPTADAEPASLNRGALMILDDLRFGRSPQALERAQQLVREHADDATALAILGGAQIAAGDERAARATSERALALDPASSTALDLQDQLDVRAGDQTAIERRLRQRLERSPGDELLTLRLVQLLSGGGRLDEATSYLRQAVAAAPQAVAARGLLLGIAARRGDAQEVDRVMAELEAIGSPDALRLAGAFDLGRNRTGDAARTLARLTSVRPDDVQAGLQLAQAQYRAGDQAAARAGLRGIWQRDPVNLIAGASLVDLALQDGDPAAARAIADDASRREPGAGAVLTARIHVKQKRPEDAVAVLAKALTETAQPSLARELFATRIAAGQTEAAVAGLGDWVREHPDDATSLRILAAEQLRRGRYEAATAPLEQAVQLLPDDPTTLNNLAWIYDRLDRPQAVDLARRAYARASGSPEIADTLGWILVRRDGLGEGLPLLREAHARLPEQPEVAYHLAYALERSGDQAGARELLTDVVAAPTSFDGLDAAKKLLARLGNS